jgi:hypothetical protein
MNPKIMGTLGSPKAGAKEGPTQRSRSTAANKAASQAKAGAGANHDLTFCVIALMPLTCSIA